MVQVPSPETDSHVILPLGEFHVAALQQTPETQGMVAAFQTTQTTLLTAARATEDAARALVGPRVAVRFAEYALEQVLRSTANAAHDADNNQSTGPAFRSVFPGGLEAETSPRGASQLRSAADVRTRLANQPAAAGLRATFLPRLDAAIADFGTKLDTRTAAGRALGEAQAAESGARESWVAHYDGNAGAVRNLFPRNRARQELYFDEFRGRGARRATDDDAPPALPPISGAGSPTEG
ncbi:MAG TPA: hypothetical protein VG389_27970 [Myxococcota bacterium]|jgi:hypothetical protein|nr:hypothetical protein [Myxococcota bacterium]